MLTRRTVGGDTPLHLEVVELLENYTPLLQTLSIVSIRKNIIDITSIPKFLLAF